MNRLFRQMRYRFIYPVGAPFLFPMKKLPDLDLFSSDHKLFGYRKALSQEMLIQKAEELCHHRFSFLNLSPVELGRPVNWPSEEQDPLWQYNLHYGEWSETLADAFHLTNDIRYRDAIIDLISDWIEHNPVCSRPGWEPYPISRRIVSWSRVGMSILEDEKWISFWKDSLGPSLHQQTRVLSANLEKDISNNHLIANYKALAWMGLLLSGCREADDWRSLGLDGIWSEMRQQMLADGVHDERSISYHTIVLQDIIEIWHLCKQTGHEVPADVEPAILKMLRFLSEMIAPDGSYPMLNDTVPGYPCDPKEVLLAGTLLFNYPEDKTEIEYKSLAVYPDSGYVILRDENNGCLYFDAGAMGPDHLPGHGHADALSFVLYGKGRPLIVDPGVYTYHDSQWRDYFRSTAVHNTMSVDGQDQCVFWGNFRVAYPPKVRLLEFAEDHVTGEHEGYSRLSHPVIHKRTIKKIGHGKWEVLDSLMGKGEHDFSLSLQFAPGAEVKREGTQTIVIWPGGVKLWISVVSHTIGAEIMIEKGWISSGWNMKEEAPRFVLKWRSQVPVENRLNLLVS